MTPLLEEQIAAALETILPLTVYPVILPRTPDYPAVTYHRRDYEIKNDQWSMNPLYLASVEGSRSLFQVVIYAPTYTECAHLLREVKTALEAVPGMILDSINDGYEWKQEVYAIVTEWAVWGDLDTPTESSASPEQWPDLQPFILAMLEDLTTSYSDRVSTIGLHNPQTRGLSTPALVLDINSISVGEDLGDDRHPLQVSWALHCLFPQKQDGLISPVASMAAELVGYLRWQKWHQGDRMDYPKNINATRGTLWPGLYSQWIVSWDQTVYPTTDEEPEITADAAVSWTPQTGPEYADDYEKLPRETCP